MRTVICILFALFCSMFLCPGCKSKKPPLMPDPVFKVIGPTSEEIELARTQLLGFPEFQTFFQGERYRLLSFKPILEDNKTSSIKDTVFVSKYFATGYDYSNNKAYEIYWSPGDKQIKIVETENILDPSLEEVEEARQALISTLGLADSVKNGAISVSQAMPPAIRTEKGKRALSFWVLGAKHAKPSGLYQVTVSDRDYAVENINNSVDHLDFSLPSCGPTYYGSTGLPTAFLQVQIPDPDVFEGYLWEFKIVPPYGSSGDQGSGVELLDVYYRGILVLKRTHAPKLNVLYNSSCTGTSLSAYCDVASGQYYNDGINLSTVFKATGTNVATGFIKCDIPPVTIADDGDDSGNFSGVAMYSNPSANSFLVTSELQYGHYRYVSEWTFYTDGTIEPRFKFGAVSNLCTCNYHKHHVYWRFDFDVNGPVNTVTESHATKVKGGPIDWTSISPFTIEASRYRSFPQMMWSVNGAGDKQCDLIAGEHDGDGTNDSWTKGDVFVSKYYATQINEWGRISANGADGDQHGCFNAAHLINGESVSGQDIVIWYRAGSLHDESAADHSDQHHVVGPTIKCHWTHPLENE